MIGLLRSSFHKTDKVFDEKNMCFIKRHFLEGEKLIDLVPIYKCDEVFAFFTNKRIVFVCSPDNPCTLNKPCEIEFLPYRSIQRFSFLDANIENAYKVDITVSGKIDISFFMTNQNEAVDISRIIGEYSI